MGVKIALGPCFQFFWVCTQKWDCTIWLTIWITFSEVPSIPLHLQPWVKPSQQNLILPSWSLLQVTELLGQILQPHRLAGGQKSHLQP